MEIFIELLWNFTCVKWLALRHNYKGCLHNFVFGFPQGACTLVYVLYVPGKHKLYTLPFGDACP